MRILLGVTGGVAAYKAAELVRLLQTRGAEVEVAMTASAERFVAAQTFAALTGRRVYTSLWQADEAETAGQTFEIEHITAGQRIDALVIAPCTAHTLARLAQGLADDFLSTLYLATRAPVVIAPAMNVHMWEHPATQANVSLLRSRGALFVEPSDGYLACGMTGGGRLAPLERIVETVFTGDRAAHPFAASPQKGGFGTSLPPKDLTGETALITAGGTRESIDPVRFLTNRSSGRMGHALAEAAVARGARVLLVTASSLPTSAAIERAEATTAAEMHAAVLALLPQATLVIGAAAVADYRVVQPSSEKLRRKGPLTLELEPTEDIIADAARRRSPGTVVIAFAAETQDGEQNAREKLVRKGVDAVVMNDVSAPGLGFDSERNAGVLVTAAARVELPPSSKREMAERILDEVASLREALVRIAVPSR